MIRVLFSCCDVFVFQKQSPSPQPSTESMDMSFSTSFGCEEIISAVDKLERDYGKTKTVTARGDLDAKSEAVDCHSIKSKHPKDGVKELELGNSNTATSKCHSKKDSQTKAKFANHFNTREVKQNKNAILTTRSAGDKTNTSKVTGNVENIGEKQLKNDDTNNLVTKHGQGNASKVRACQLKPETKENVKSTPNANIGRHKSRLSMGSSFLLSPDILWASPQGISTPQELTGKGTKTKSNGSVSNTSQSAKNRKKNSIAKLPTAGTAKVEITPVRHKESTRSNKSDFFKSLFMEKSPDISVSPDSGELIVVDKSPDNANSVAVADPAVRGKDISAKRPSDSITADINRASLQTLEKKEAIQLNKNKTSKVENVNNNGCADKVLAEDSTDDINTVQAKLSLVQSNQLKNSADKASVHVVENVENQMLMITEGENRKVVHNNNGNTGFV